MGEMNEKNGIDKDHIRDVDGHEDNGLIQTPSQLIHEISTRRGRK